MLSAAEKSPTSHCTFLLPCTALVFFSRDPQNCLSVWGQVMASAQPEQPLRREPRCLGHPAQGRQGQAGAGRHHCGHGELVRDTSYSWKTLGQATGTPRWWGCAGIKGLWGCCADSLLEMLKAGLAQWIENQRHGANPDLGWERRSQAVGDSQPYCSNLHSQC